jgi:FkbH-like protein
MDKIKIKDLRERKVVKLKDIGIAVLSSYTLKNIQYPLEYKLLLNGFDPKISYGGYQQFIQEFLDPTSWIHSSEINLIFLAISTNTYLNDLEDKLLNMDSKEVYNYISEKIFFLKNAILNSKINAKIVITTLDMPVYSPFGILDLIKEPGMAYAIQLFNKQLIEMSNSMKNVTLLDFNKMLLKIGTEKAFDEKLFRLGKILLSQEGINELSDELVSIINASYGNVKKCLVVDLDNTLWGGVVGEEGYQGIKIGGTNIGEIYAEIQKIILNYKKRGVLLAICSKNNENDVREVFLKNKNMILKEDDFVVKAINWEPKSKNIASIAKKLNIGVDSLVFLDDNPAERLEVKTAIPSVEVIDFPEDISLLPKTLKSLNYFNTLSITEEDKKRSELYLEEIKREELKEEYKLEDYLVILNTSIKVKKNDIDSIDRITQLINKTNQFNLRTQRYTLEQVKAFMESEESSVYSLEVFDKFGALGLTGVAILNNGNSFIDTFLLSCRILSRKIEYQFFNEIVKSLKNPEKLIAEYLPSPKNQQVESFYDNLGFKLVDNKNGAKRYEIFINQSNLPQIPWIRVQNG